MTLQDVTVQAKNPTFSAMVGAGIDVRAAHTQAPAFYEALHSALGGKESEFPVLKSIKGRGYLPKVLNQAGKPVLQWGAELLDLSSVMNGDSPVDYEFLMADASGYEDPHLALSMVIDDVTYVTHFPVGIKGKDVTQSKANGKAFLMLLKRDLYKALNEYARTPNPLVGLPMIDEVLVDDAETDVEVVVIAIQVVSPTWVKVAVEFDGETYQCGTMASAKAALAAPIIKEGSRIPARVRKGKTYFNVYEVSLTPEHLNIG